MNTRSFIFWGIVIIIVVLSLFNAKLGSLENSFNKYCLKQYNITSECPCLPVSNTYEGLNISNIPGLNSITK